MMEFLFIFAGLLVAVATGPALLVAYHRYLSHRYDIPDLWDIARQMIHRSEEVSSASVITQRIGRRMRGMSTRMMSGKSHIAPVHQITMAPGDVDALSDTIGLTAVVQDYADAYAAHAAKNGYEGDRSGPLEIYIVSDPQCMPNHPRISSVRPRGGQQPYLVTPGGLATAPSDFLAFTKLPEPEKEPSAVSAEKPEPTRHYASTAAPGGGGDATTYLKDWASDGTSEPATLLLDGKTVSRLSGGKVQIGRGTECAVRLTDRTVSRLHATLEDRNGVWTLMPQEGRICRVNGGLVMEPLPLADGDILTFATSPEKVEFRA